MAKTPFEKFPPSFKPLIERLPPPDENGVITPQWQWHEELADLMVELDRRLRRIERDVKNARSAGDIDAVRSLVAVAVIQIQEHLLPIFGADGLWPLTKGVEALEHAARQKRYWLTALPGDELHTRRDAPSRLKLQAMAAATLEYFEPRIDGSQEEIAARIAKAMAVGGFRTERHQPPNKRTVQDWRNHYLLGKRRGRRPTNPDEKGVYEAILRELKRAGQGRAPTAMFDDWILEFSDHCRDAKEISRPAAKSGD